MIISSNMKPESLYKNTVFSLIFTVIIGLLAFLINRVFSDQLGQENLGLLRLFSQLVAYLSIAELGVNAAAIAILFKPLQRNDYKKVSSVLFTVDYFYKRIAFLIFSLGLLLNFGLPFLIENVNSDVYLYWSLYVISTAITYLFAKYPILLSADQRYGFVQTVRSLLKISMNLAQIFSLFYFKSFYLFVCLILLSNFIEWMVFVRFYKIHYRNLIPQNLVKNTELITKTKQVFVHRLAGVLIFNTDYLIITKFVGLNAVAIYSSYLLIFQFVQLLINNVAQVVTPKVGAFYATNSIDKVKELWKKIYSLNCYLATIIVSILYVMLIDIVELWMGSEYLIPSLLLWLLLVNLYIEISRKTLDLIITVSGYYKYMHLPILEGGGNLIASLILVQYFGVVGVVLGTVISNVVITVFWKPILVLSHVIGVGYLDYLKELLKHVFFLFGSISLISQYNSTGNVFFDLAIVTGLAIVVVSFIYLLEKNFRLLILVFMKKQKYIFNTAPKK
ncbi:hypothetical protein FG053_12410 [Vibrio cholerae]|nr:hypothetical protein [Vibrio cholerae]TXY98417.1 oligosaccharide flippase family protein [Vibrio cholerae]